MNVASEPNLPLRFQRIDTLTDLQALVEPWRELLADSLVPEPMLSPAWLLTWWDLYAEDRTLSVGLFFDGDRLVGLAPFCSRVHRYRPAAIPFQRLEALGSGSDEKDGVCSDYLNVLARGGYEAAVADAFVQQVMNGSFGPWHEFVLEAMDGTHPMLAFLNSAFFRAGLRVEQTVTNQAPYLQLPASWDDFLKSLSKKRRQAFVYAMRDFKAWAGDEYAVHVADSEESLAQGLTILADLHRQRWSKEPSEGAFHSPRFVEFHTRYARASLRAGELELLWLTVRGQPVAAMYGFAAGSKIYFYQCGRVMDVPKQVRLGIVMLIFAMQRAMAAGHREFDFLAGEAPYKRQFTETSRPIVQLRVARPTIRESIRRGLRWGVTKLRALRGTPTPTSDVNENEQ